MKTRTIDKPKDLPHLLDWYRDQGWQDSLSDLMFPSLGYMVDDHAAVWLFKDVDAKFGFMAWMVINPRKNRALAFRALHMLYERVERDAKDMGIKMITHTVSHSSLKKLALQHNYMQGDIELSSYWKAI